MRTLILTVIIAITGFIGLPAFAQSESSFEASSSIGTNTDFIAGNLGIVLSEGPHGYLGASVDHESGFFVEGWGTVPFTNSNDPDTIKYEYDGFIGWKGKVGEISIRADYSVFVVDTGDVDGVIENARLFATWERDGVQPYARFQYFLNDGFGPGGPGLAHVLGAKYQQVSVEFGGHNGLLGQDATFVSFVRAGVSSNPIDFLGGATLSMKVQAGLEDPVEDQMWFALHKGF